MFNNNFLINNNFEHIRATIKERKEKIVQELIKNEENNKRKQFQEKLMID